MVTRNRVICSSGCWFKYYIIIYKFQNAWPYLFSPIYWDFMLKVPCSAHFAKHLVAMVSVPFQSYWHTSLSADNPDPWWSQHVTPRDVTESRVIRVTRASYMLAWHHLTKPQWSCCSCRWSQLQLPLGRCSVQSRTVCRSGPGCRCIGCSRMGSSDGSSHMFIQPLSSSGDALGGSLLPVESWDFVLRHTQSPTPSISLSRLPGEFHWNHVAKLLKHLLHPCLIHILSHCKGKKSKKGEWHDLNWINFLMMKLILGRNINWAHHPSSLLLWKRFRDPHSYPNSTMNHL